MKKKMVRPEIKVIKMETVSALASSETPETIDAKGSFQNLTSKTMTMTDWVLQ